MREGHSTGAGLMMEYALSTHLFVGERLTPRLLDRIAAEGFPFIEIFAMRQHFDYQDAKAVREIARWFSDHALRLRSLHAPLYQGFEWGRDGSPAISLADLEKRRRIESMDEVRRAIEVSDSIPFEFLILHLGVPGEEYSLEKFDAAFSAIESLRLFARQLGVRILLENIPNELSTPPRLLQFLQYNTKLPDVALCFDTGHAHMTTGVDESFAILQDFIVSTHVHDNRGQTDDHLFPFAGSIDWNPIVKRFRRAASQFPVLFELRDYGESQDPLARVRSVMARFDSLS